MNYLINHHKAYRYKFHLITMEEIINRALLKEEPAGLGIS